MILDADGNPVPEGEIGEIVIAGDTVALGYAGRPELTAEAFGTVQLAGQQQRCYRTGDLGWVAGGQLWFGGRRDGQIKLHGYRIEVEDVAANLRKLPGVRQAVVLPVSKADDPGTVDHLAGFVEVEQLPEGSKLGAATALKRQLKEFLPDYMVPKVLKFTTKLPLTANGKVDRQQLREQLR